MIALYIISRMRSGAMVSDVLNGMPLDMNILFILFMAIFSVSIAAYFITILLGDWILPVLTRINYHLLCMSVLTGLTILIFLFTGWFGLVVYGAAVPIGMLAPYLKVRRTHAMGVLLLPLLIYYFNI